MCVCVHHRKVAIEMFNVNNNICLEMIRNIFCKNTNPMLSAHFHRPNTNPRSSAHFHRPNTNPRSSAHFHRQNTNPRSSSHFHRPNTNPTLSAHFIYIFIFYHEFYFIFS